MTLPRGSELLVKAWRVAPYLLVAAAVLALFWAGRLPAMAPPLPRPESSTRGGGKKGPPGLARALGPSGTSASHRRASSRRPSARDVASETIATRLLDHLASARRAHPNLARAYRRLAVGKAAPGHWRHYVDPWSRLPASLRLLRVQMTFAFRDVRSYCPDQAPGGRSPAAASGRDQGHLRRPRARRRRHGGPRQDVRPRGGRPHRPQFGRDKSMNKTPGVNEMRLSLFAPTPSSFTFAVSPGPGAALTFGAGVPANGPHGSVTFQVEISRPSSAEPPKVVASFTVDRRGRHRWHDHRVDLSPWSGSDVLVTLRTRGPAGALAFWSNPLIWRRGAPAPGRNVIFILIDTLRADGVGRVFGGRPVTPNIDSLGKRGVSFEKAFSMASWTRSSMLGIFSSEPVTRHSSPLNTSLWLRRSYMRKLYERWPRLLTLHVKSRGYWVEAIGNNFFLPAFTPIGFDRGFDRVTDIRAHQHDTPAITRGAVRFLRAHRHRPFFLYLHYDGPHQPYLMPRGYRVRGAMAPGDPHDLTFEKYLGEARWTDANLGPLFAEIARLGLFKDTVVVLTADHGEVFDRAHDYIIGHRGSRTLHRHGWSPYEEVLHVPLILVGPGLPPGRRVPYPVTHMDLAPTLLEAAGLPPMAGSMGRSLLGAIQKSRRPPERPIAAVARWSYGIRDGRWRYIYRLGPGRILRSPRRPERKVYVVDELYDLRADPRETRNLAKKHPKLVASLRKKLLEMVEPATGGSRAQPEAGPGLHLSIRLWGGKDHTLSGSISCPGSLLLRGLLGSSSSATSQRSGRLELRLANTGGRPAEAEVELRGCPSSSIRLALRLDGKPLETSQVVAGPAGLALMPQPPDRLPSNRLPAFVSLRPPVLLASPVPRVHLWLGSTYQEDPDAAVGQGAASRLADQMLRDAGYSRGSTAKGARPTR